jgi:hypothetical protein
VHLKKPPAQKIGVITHRHVATLNEVLRAFVLVVKLSCIVVKLAEWAAIAVRTDVLDGWFAA